MSKKWSSRSGVRALRSVVSQAQSKARRMARNSFRQKASDIVSVAHANFASDRPWSHDVFVERILDIIVGPEL